MKRKFIPAEESFTQWKEDPKYIAEYNAQEKEFALASAFIEAQHNADALPGRSRSNSRPAR